MDKLPLKDIQARYKQQNMVKGEKKQILGWKLGTTVRCGYEEDHSFLAKVVGYNQDGSMILIQYIKGDRETLSMYDWKDILELIEIEQNDPGIYDHCAKMISVPSRPGKVYYWAHKTELEKVADPANLKLKIKLPKADGTITNRD